MILTQEIPRHGFYLFLSGLPSQIQVPMIRQPPRQHDHMSPTPLEAESKKRHLSEKFYGPGLKKRSSPLQPPTIDGITWSLMSERRRRTASAKYYDAETAKTAKKTKAVNAAIEQSPAVEVAVAVEEPSSPAFQRRFYHGMLFDGKTPGVWSTPSHAAVRLYVHPPKDIVDLVDTADPTRPTIYDNYVGGVLRPYSGTFVIEENHPRDVPTVLNMIHAAVTTFVPQESARRSMRFSPLIAPDDDDDDDDHVILLQFLHSGEGEEESRKTKTRELLDIGFRIVGKIKACFAVGHDGAIIFEARVKTLLATPAPVEKFAFKSSGLWQLKKI